MNEKSAYCHAFKIDMPLNIASDNIFSNTKDSEYIPLVLQPVTIFSNTSEYIDDKD